MTTTVTIAEINALPREDFVRIVGPVFEHSPWIAERTAGPFTDVDDLHMRLCAKVNAASPAEQLSLVVQRPERSGICATMNQNTPSTAEHLRVVIFADCVPRPSGALDRLRERNGRLARLLVFLWDVVLQLFNE